MKRRRIVQLAVVAAAVTAVVIVSQRDSRRKPLPTSDSGNEAPEGMRSAPTGGTARAEASVFEQEQTNALRQAASPPLPREAILSRLASLELSPAVRTIVGLAPGKSDAKSRSDALNELTTQLSEADVEGLSLFLQLRHDDSIGIPIKTWNALRNDALDILLRQEGLKDGLGLQMAAMYHDGTQDEVWRDYCIQYLAGYYDRRYPAEKEKPETAEREEMLKAYWDAAAEKDRTIAGTALIGLEDLSRRHEEVDRGRVSDRACELATDEECSEASRITALRLCGMMGRSEVLPTARILAQTAETTTLRMAAIATVGDLGSEKDVPLLESLVGSSEKRIAGIAEQALGKVRKAAVEPTDRERSDGKATEETKAGAV